MSGNAQGNLRSNQGEDMNRMIEELSIVELEQRIEFSCCGGDGGPGGPGGGGGSCDLENPCQPK
jgi:hypothetical protein